MKRKIKDNITASTNLSNEIVFTADEVLALLQSIIQLKDFDISLVDNGNNTLTLTIGDTTYKILDCEENTIE
jgi:Tfp pilus assembly protein PilO